MRKYLILTSFLFALILIYSCKKSNEKSNLNSKIILNLPDVPYDYNLVIHNNNTKNNVLYEDGSPINNKMATIGRVLFYDKALSINNSISCASCHIQENAFADVKSLSKGFNEKNTIRNSMSIANLSDDIGIGYFWDTRQKKIENMVFEPISNHIEMGFTRIDLLANKLSNLNYYQELFKDCYGTEEITEEKLRKCLSSFLFSIVSSNSKFDDVIGRRIGKFTEEEENGFKLFTKSGCNLCHKISSFTTSYYGSSLNNSIANIGLETSNVDKGINGKYKVPKLFNISRTGPYMHDGRFKTLEQVIDHYSNGIKDNKFLSDNLKALNKNGKFESKKFNFSEQDKKDLVSFLKTLDDVVMLNDVKFSSPFKN